MEFGPSMKINLQDIYFLLNTYIYYENMQNLNLYHLCFNSRVIPILKPQSVVDDIIAGILTNQEQIVIPRPVYVLLVLKM